jgi:hypothetical protein
MRFGVVLLLVIVVAVVLATRRREHDADELAEPRPRRAARPGPAAEGVAVAESVPRPLGTGVARAVADAIERWRDAGLVDDTQADALLTYERARRAPEAAPRPASRVPAVAEALGYLGACLALAGTVLVVARAWPDLAFGVRLGLCLGASLALWAVGAAVHVGADPALSRLRAAAWVGSTAAFGVFAAVAARDGLPTDLGATQALAASAAVALHAGALWRFGDRPAQQVPAVGGALVAVGSAAMVVIGEDAVGPAVWIAGALVLAVGLRHLGPHPHLTTVAGAVAVVVGGLALPSPWRGPGLVVATATALGLLVLAEAATFLDRADRRILGVVGAIGFLQTFPPTLAHYADHAGVATGAVVWLLGAGTLAVALRGHLQAPRLAQVAGALAVLGGAAVTAAQIPDVGPALGVASAIALLVVGTAPGAVVVSLVGALGLLIDVPWTITRWFPGQDRAALIVVVAGLVILAVAVFLARMGGRLRSELGRHRRGPLHPAT